MYEVALIQNQSEMSHYSYADARSMLEEFGYQSVLYTAQNIDELDADLTRLKFDAIIFASNALNDKTIRENVMSDEFKSAFENFIKNGKACLILHQLRMAQDNLSLKFIPTPLSNIQPKVRDEKEKASKGELHLTSIAKDHACLLYPHTINIDKVKDRCLSFRSLKGLYWHYWGNVSGTDWDILLYDVDQHGFERPLIISSKEPEPFRIVLCSLTLDWQKQKRLLQNFLTYVVEGKHNTAILKDFRNVSVGFEYFVECLKAQKYPFRIYDIDQNLKDVERNIRNGVHTIIIFGPFVEEKKLSNKILLLIKHYVNEGRVKLVNITQDEKLKRFYIAGRERFAHRLLHDLELKVQKELSAGYIDGSFWSTVESLQILNEISSYTKSRYDKQILGRVLEIANTHDRNGSYDEVFGVSCALAWLRVTYLETGHSDTQCTLKWIRDNLKDYEDREKVLAYFTMIDITVATNDEETSLRNLLIDLQVKLERLSEIDLIVYLKAVVKIGIKDIIVSIIRYLRKKQKNGCWVDLATTATAVTALLDALQFLKREDPTEYVRTREILEPMIFKSIIYIQNTIEKKSESVTYPWDNKASTSLKCIQAWLKFEDLIDLPVRELIDALKSYSITEVIKSSTKTSLTILDELRSENRRLLQKMSKLSADAQKSRKIFRLNKYLWITSLSTIYATLSIILYSLFVGGNTPIKDLIVGVFIKGWPFHIAFLTLIATLFGGIPWWKQKFKEGDKNG